MLSEAEYLLLKRYALLGTQNKLRKKTATDLLKLQSMKKEVINYYEDFSAAKTAEHFEVSLSTLWKFLKIEHVLPIRGPIRASSLRPTTLKRIDEMNVVVKVNEEIAPTMESCRELLPDKFLAEKYGISRQAIGYLRNKVALPSAREISAPYRQKIKEQRRREIENRKLDRMLDLADKKKAERLEHRELFNRILGFKFK